MQNLPLPTLLIVSEWHAPLGEVEIFVENLAQALDRHYEIHVAVRLHDERELPILAAPHVTLHRFVSSHDFIKLVTTMSPSLIHFQQSTKLALKLASNHKLQNIPTLGTLHFVPSDALPNQSPFRPQAWSHLQQLGRIMPLVATSPAVHRAAIQNFVPLTRHIISSGTDTGRYHPGDQLAARHELELPADGRYVLYNGHPADPELSRLIAYIATQGTATLAHLLVATELAGHELSATLDQLGTRGRYTSLAHISHDDERYPLIYQAANIFVAPSPMSHEVAFTLEAMASGLRVTSVSQLREALSLSYTQPELARAYGEANRKQAEQLDMHHIAAAYQAIYERLLSRAR